MISLKVTLEILDGEKVAIDGVWLNDTSKKAIDRVGPDSNIHRIPF